MYRNQGPAVVAISIDADALIVNSHFGIGRQVPAMRWLQPLRARDPPRSFLERIGVGAGANQVQLVSFDESAKPALRAAWSGPGLAFQPSVHRV